MENQNNTLKKELGLLALTSIGVGGTIGSGIFALPAIMGAIAGPSFILAILLTGVIASFVAICYAELGSTFPITGGPYSLPRLAMGDLGGFMMGWGYFIHLFTSTAAIMNVFIVYLGFFVPNLSHGQTLTPYGSVIAVGLLWMFTIINIAGVKWGGLYAIVTTIGKIIPLLLFGLIGIVSFNSNNFVPFMPFGLGSITIATAICFWAFLGFEAIVVPADEIKNPKKHIPIAILLTILITTIVYSSVSLGFTSMIDWKYLGLAKGNWKGIGELGFPLSAIAKAHTFKWLALITTIGAIISTAGTAGTWVLIQGRMPYAMARDKLFWKPLSIVSSRFHTPVKALIFATALSSLCIIFVPHFPSIAMIASSVVILPSAAATIALPILRRTKSDVKRAFRLPFHIPISLIGFILCTCLLYWASWPWTLISSLLIFTGYFAFFIFTRKNFQFLRNSWIVIYLLGISFISYLAHPDLCFNNFINIQPLGILHMPYDLLVLTLFAIMIYLWAYFSNIRFSEKYKVIEDQKI
jgi:basic amino acid/polyamine antiporter, APA family